MRGGLKSQRRVIASWRLRETIERNWGKFVNGITEGRKWNIYVQIESAEQYEFSHDHRSPLEIDRLPAIVAEILDLEHRWVGKASYLR